MTSHARISRGRVRLPGPSRDGETLAENEAKSPRPPNSGEHDSGVAD